MDEENVVYTYDEILFSRKNEINPVYATTWLKLEDIYAKGNKPVTEGQILVM